MKVTDAFLGEHGVIYALFDHLESVVPETETLAELRAQVRLLAAGLATHAQLEENLLFVLLEPILGTGMGPLAVMRMEHEEVEGTLATLPEIEDLGEAKGLILHVVQVARDHFRKEEQVLFPLACQGLGDARLAEVGEIWAQRRDVMAL